MNVEYQTTMSPDQYLARAGTFEQMGKDAASKELREEYLRLAAEWRALAKAVGERKGKGLWSGT